MTERRSDCPVSCVLDLVGDRWTLLVVRDLLLGKEHFDDFLASPEKIATNILSRRLHTLQSLGYVERLPGKKDRRRHTYRLTDQGQPLRKLVRSMKKWGLKNIPGTRFPEPAPTE